MKRWLPLDIPQDLAGVARIARRRTIAAMSRAQLCEQEGDHDGAQVWWEQAMIHSRIWLAAIPGGLDLVQ